MVRWGVVLVAAAVLVLAACKRERRRYTFAAAPAARGPEQWRRDYRRKLNRVRQLARQQTPFLTGRIDGLARPSIRLQPTGAAAATRFGGLPDLPVGVEWPRRDGVPLEFLAQLDLGELAPLDLDGALPAAGRLYVFYDAEAQPWGERGQEAAWRVIYGEASSGFRPAAPPAGLRRTFTGVPLAASIDVTLPDYEEAEIDALKLADAQNDAYYELREEVGQMNVGVGTRHRVLGHPDAIQGSVAADVVTATGRGPAEAWRLLLQIDSDDGPGWMWGDAGSLYLMIHADDLRARRFDRVWLVLQCF